MRAWCLFVRWGKACLAKSLCCTCNVYTSVSCDHRPSIVLSGIDVALARTLVECWMWMGGNTSLMWRTHTQHQHQQQTRSSSTSARKQEKRKRFLKPKIKQSKKYTHKTKKTKKRKQSRQGKEAKIYKEKKKEPNTLLFVETGGCCQNFGVTPGFQLKVQWRVGCTAA